MQLFSGFPVKGFGDTFPVRDVPANGSVPLERKQILFGTALLDVHLPFPIDDVQMYDRMKDFGATMTIFARSLCHNQSGGFHYRQHFRSRRTARPEAESSAHSK